MPDTTTNYILAASLEEAAEESPRRPPAQAVLAVLTDSRYAKRPQHAAVGRSYRLPAYRQAGALILSFRQGGKHIFYNW